MRDFLALVGACTILGGVMLAGIALHLGYRAAQIRRPYRDEHQGA